jgi:hypothetical protein
MQIFEWGFEEFFEVAANLKKLFNKRNEVQISYNVQKIETDLTLRKPKTEYLKQALGVVQSYGIVYLKI